MAPSCLSSRVCSEVLPPHRHHSRVQVLSVSCRFWSRGRTHAHEAFTRPVHTRDWACSWVVASTGTGWGQGWSCPLKTRAVFLKLPLQLFLSGLLRPEDATRRSLAGHATVRALWPISVAGRVTCVWPTRTCWECRVGGHLGFLWSLLSHLARTGVPGCCRGRLSGREPVGAPYAWRGHQAKGKSWTEQLKLHAPVAC